MFPPTRKDDAEENKVPIIFEEFEIVLTYNR